MYEFIKERPPLAILYEDVYKVCGKYRTLSHDETAFLWWFYAAIEDDFNTVKNTYTEQDTVKVLNGIRETLLRKYSLTASIHNIIARCAAIVLPTAHIGPYLPVPIILVDTPLVFFRLLGMFRELFTDYYTYLEPILTELFTNPIIHGYADRFSSVYNAWLLSLVDYPILYKETHFFIHEHGMVLQANSHEELSEIMSIELVKNCMNPIPIKEVRVDTTPGIITPATLIMATPVWIELDLDHSSTHSEHGNADDITDSGGIKPDFVSMDGIEASPFQMEDPITDGVTSVSPFTAPTEEKPDE